jgi:hypothetical protein
MRRVNGFIGEIADHATPVDSSLKIHSIPPTFDEQ